MTDHFNLLDEPWIPLRPLGVAGIRDVSLLDAVLNAHQFAEIVHPSPIVTLVLHRFVIAFLYSASRGPDRLSALERILDRGSFDETIIRQYSAKWRHRFFLFGEVPFLQDPLLAEELRADKEQPLPAEQLRRETASPNGKTLFDHTLPGSQDWQPAEAARYLLADQIFGLQDGSGYSQSPVSTGVATFVAGENLFQTIALNLVPYNSNSPIVASDFGQDAPAWEVTGSPHGIPIGWLDYVTRPYRRLLLQRDSAGGVSHVFRKSGPHLERDWRASLLDPWLSYAIKDSGPRAIVLQDSKALWRDSHALLQRFIEHGRGNADYVRLLARLNRDASIQVVGVSAKNNAVSLWRRETLPVSPAVMADEAAMNRLAWAIEAAEKAATALAGALALLISETLAPDPTAKDPCRRKPGKDAWRAAAALGGERAFWAEVGRRFPSFASFLSTGREGEAVELWTGAVNQAARSAFDTATRSIATSGRGIRAAAIVEPCFIGRLVKALAVEPTPELEEVPS